MTREEIANEIRNLPAKDAAWILRSICDCAMTSVCGMSHRVGIDEAFARYRDAMLRSNGVDCTEHTRRAGTVWARNMVAFDMLKDGFVWVEVARRLGISHSTLAHCRESMMVMLQAPQFYKTEVAMYKRYQNAKQDEIH